MLEVDGLSKRPSFKACYHFLRGVYHVVFVLFTLLLFEVNEGLLCIETSFPCQ